MEIKKQTQTEDEKIKQMFKLDKMRTVFFNNLINTENEYQKIIEFKFLSKTIFPLHSEFENIVQAAISHRKAINNIKKVGQISEFQRENETRIDYLGAYGEQLLSYLFFKFDLNNVIQNYTVSANAEYFLTKGCDFSFEFEKKKRNYEIKCNDSQLLNINEKALNHLIENDCDIIFVEIHNENVKIHKITSDFFIKHAEKKDGQGGSTYYRLDLLNAKQEIK